MDNLKYSLRHLFSNVIRVLSLLSLTFPDDNLFHEHETAKATADGDDPYCSFKYPPAHREINFRFLLNQLKSDCIHQFPVNF